MGSQLCSGRRLGPAHWGCGQGFPGPLGLRAVSFRVWRPLPHTARDSWRVVTLDSSLLVMIGGYKGLFGEQGGTRGRPSRPPAPRSCSLWERAARPQRVGPTAFRRRVSEEPEFPPPVLFGFRFGFLLGGRGGGLLRVRRGCTLSFLERAELPQDRLQLVLLLLEVQLHAGEEGEGGVSVGPPCARVPSGDTGSGRPPPRARGHSPVVYTVIPRLRGQPLAGVRFRPVSLRTTPDPCATWGQGYRSPS